MLILKDYGGNWKYVVGPGDEDHHFDDPGLGVQIFFEKKGQYNNGALILT